MSLLLSVTLTHTINAWPSQTPPCPKIPRGDNENMEVDSLGVQQKYSSSSIRREGERYKSGVVL